MGDLVKVYLCCDRDEMIEDLGERNFTRGLTRWVRCEDYNTLTARLAEAEAREHGLRDLVERTANSERDVRCELKDVEEHLDTAERLLLGGSNLWQQWKLRGNHRSCSCSTCWALDQWADEAAKGGE